MKYHHKTQKAINEWARHYLQLYRNSRTHDDPATARWRSHFAMCIKASGNVYCIIESRINKNNRAYWKKVKLEAAYSMVKGEGAGQYTFDLPKDSQLAML